MTMPCNDTFHVELSKTTKGTLGEALVQTYFEYAGWAITPTGVEDVVDHLMQQAEVNKGDLGSLPDFIVSKVAGSKRNPGTQRLGQAFYVEVKTWTHWRPDQDFSRYRKWGNVLLVWVSPAGLRGAWISRPGTQDTGPVFINADGFSDLAKVGIVQITHCATLQCQRDLRAHFNKLSTAIATLPV